MVQKRKIYFSLSMVMGLMLFTGISCTSTNEPTDSGTAPTATTGLVVSAVTSTTGGGYAPRNVYAIWIENSAGVFVKTLTVKAASRQYDLTNWGSKSNENKTDASTGATQSSFGTVYGVWNGTDASGKVVTDGTYKVCMELTDKSSTGNFSSFTFTKGTTASTLTPANVPSFSSISIKWMPL